MENLYFRIVRNFAVFSEMYFNPCYPSSSESTSVILVVAFERACMYLDPACHSVLMTFCGQCSRVDVSQVNFCVVFASNSSKTLPVRPR
jgi:hypothetical protein